MKYLLFVVLVIAVSGCDPKNPESDIGYVVAYAEKCGVDTAEFYTLATHAEKVATTSEAIRMARLACSWWTYGTRDEAERTYAHVLQSLKRRAL